MNETYWILLASLIVGAIFHWIRFYGGARVARIRSFGARALNLGLSIVAAPFVVWGLSFRIIVVAAIIYCVSSVAEAAFVSIQTARGKM